MTSVSRGRIGIAVAAGLATTLVSVGIAATGASASPTAAPAPTGAGISLPAGLSATVFASSGGVTGADDIAKLGTDVYVGYQNGVGAKGEPAPSGKTGSTIVRYDRRGHELGRWDVTGKVDGLGADPAGHRVIATVNEDGDSSVYTLTPGRDGATVRHYAFSQNPLPHGGGTDSVLVRGGTIYLTASAPAADADGTTYSGPALYTVDLEGTTAKVTPVLNDNATATDAVTGKPVTLNLSDPDSSGIVPTSVPRFGGEVALDSQGDSQLIFLPHGGHQKPTVLNLTTQVDDTAFASTENGTLYVVDSGHNDVVAITGHFQPGEAITAVPTDSTVLPGTLGRIDLRTGTVTALGKGFGNPKGLLFVAEQGGRGGDNG